MKTIKIMLMLFAGFCFTGYLKAESKVQKQLFSIITGQPASEYRYLEDFYYLAQLKPRIEDTLKRKITDEFALAIAACIRSSSHPDNPDTVLLGVPFNKIDSQKAIQICELAYEMGGDKVGMVITSLSRAYNKAENYQKSFALAKEAVTLPYAFGNVMMAIHYAYGDGVEKNVETSFIWYKKAAEEGITASMRATAANYMKGKGVKRDLKKAFYWAEKALLNNDGKGFYQLAEILEAAAKTKTYSRKTLLAAKEAFELASYNGIYTLDDINRINKVINPNKFYNNPVLSKPSIKGKVIDGIFFPDEADGNWYLGDPIIGSDSLEYNYARVSYAGSIFTLWSYYLPAMGKTQWYADFFYAGDSKIQSFESIRVITRMDQSISLEISDPILTELATGYRMTAKLNFNDLLYLLRGKNVKIGYRILGTNRLVSFQLPLNEEVDSFEQKKTMTTQVIAKLFLKNRKKNPNCCQSPKVSPLTQKYNAFQFLCSDKQSELQTAYRIKYNCDRLALYATDQEREDAINGVYMESYLGKFLNRAKRLINP